MNTTRRYTFVFALLIAHCVACQRPILGYYETKTENDIAFVERDGKPIRMNVAHPIGIDGPRPAVLWIHGGGWAGGSRAGLQSVTETCAAFGYVAATTDYRLTPDGYEFPAALEDVAAALDYLVTNADRFGLDANRIVVGGDSAGGHLALLVAMCHDPKLLALKPDHAAALRVRGVVNIYGPTDMPALAGLRPINPITRPLLDRFMGEPPSKAPQRWKDASPVTFVSHDGPPILTIHGDADTVVPFQQAEAVTTRCDAVGQSHRLIRVRGAGHGWFSLPNGPTTRRVMPAILHFLAETTR